MTSAATTEPPAAASPPSPLPPRGDSPKLTALLVAVPMLALAGGLLAWALQILLPRDWPGAPLAAAMAVLAITAPLLLLLARHARELAECRRRLAGLDTVDGATGTSSREHFLALAEREWARARRYGHGAALLLIDIDRFQRLVDTRGHEVANAVLRELAQRTDATLRGPDALARFGGAQFVVWLAHADPMGALDAAERIRETIEALDIKVGRLTLRVTVSVGVCALRPAHQNLAAMLDELEAAMLVARQLGGNCVRAAPVDRLPLRENGPSVGDNQAAGPV